ncbi:MAG: o-succinylbenzoate--CoA ligase, partial [candidate division Zixibacteria bacterium]|nr:o-succinylbenzoate--CoA ligase [candidate division Zixibacteria bacterium]
CEDDRAATVIFTSGTTTAPKAVLHSFGNHYYSAIGSNENIPVSPPDRWLLSLPLYHVGGLAIMFRMLLGGGTVVVGSGDDQIGESVERYQITHLSLVPTQLIRLLQEGLSPSATKRLKAVLIGGGPVRPELMVAAGDRGWPVFSTYGLTEMASQVTTSAPNDTQARSSTSGRLLSGRELIISPAGEILVRGKTLFAGYFNSKRVEKATDDEGWFHTGDTGALDCDGNLTVSGRLDNMFVSGGENIHPEEIETRLSGLQGVLQALVVPLADKEFGLRPTAILKLSSDTSLPVADITAHLEKHLPRFKIPVRLLQWPQSDGGGEMKPDRRRFRKLVQENAVADIT